jgi:hypothetical protein
MALMKKLKKMVDRVVEFMTEDVEEPDKVEQLNKEVRKSAKVIETVEKKLETPAARKNEEIPVSRKVEEKPVKPVEKKVRPIEPTPFVTVGSAEKKPAEPPKPQPAVSHAEPVREKESGYVPRNVISPIFGSGENATERYSTSPMVQYDDETTQQSVIGTIFSPIHGKYVPQAQPDDEVSAEVASLTTTDFIEKVSGQPQADQQPAFLDADYNTMSVQDLEPLQPVSEPAHEPEAEIISAQPVIRPQSDEAEEGYENLSLF